MSNTIRKDRNGKKYKESLKKKEGGYRCTCHYCVGVDRNELSNKIAKRELKTQLKADEYTIDNNGNYIEDIDDPYFTACNK